MINPFNRIGKMKGIAYARDLAEQLEDIGDMIPTNIFDRDEAQRLRINLGRVGKKDRGKSFSVVATTELDAPDDPEEIGRYWVKRTK